MPITPETQQRLEEIAREEADNSEAFRREACLQSAQRTYDLLRDEVEKLKASAAAMREASSALVDECLMLGSPGVRTLNKLQKALSDTAGTDLLARHKADIEQCTKMLESSHKERDTLAKQLEGVKTAGNALREIVQIAKDVPTHLINKALAQWRKVAG